MRVTENYSLLAWNTFGMDVRARVFAEYDTIEELRALLKKYHKEKLWHIGCGSNLLFMNDYDGVVLHSRIVDTEVLQETDDTILVRCGAGIVFDDFVADAVRHGVGGAENLSYIPGEVGAAAVQNIGAYGVEAKDIIEQVETINRQTYEKRTFSNADCKYGYRDSIFKNELKDKYIVTAVVFRLQKRPILQLDYGNVRQSLAGIENPTIADVRSAIIDIRQHKLPEVSILGSAGSFFKNPVVSKAKFEQLRSIYPAIPHYEASDGVKVPAAWLIEQSGMKGKRRGGAQVYEKQPLVIINTGNALPEDVAGLAEEIRKKVKQLFDIEIQPEVNYIY